MIDNRAETYWNASGKGEEVYVFLKQTSTKTSRVPKQLWYYFVLEMTWFMAAWMNGWCSQSKLVANHFELPKLQSDSTSSVDPTWMGTAGPPRPGPRCALLQQLHGSDANVPHVTAGSLSLSATEISPKKSKKTVDTTVVVFSRMHRQCISLFSFLSCCRESHKLF